MIVYSVILIMDTFRDRNRILTLKLYEIGSVELGFLRIQSKIFHSQRNCD